MKVKITADVYNITDRLKVVDRDYKVFFDTKTRNFEVYFGPNLAFVAGKRLNATTISKAYTSHIRNSHRIIEEMNERNAVLEKHERLLQKEKYMRSFRDKLAYADNKGDIDFN